MELNSKQKTMEKKRKPLQVYAIIICVVAVITVIINVASLMSALIDKSDPLMASYSKTELSSFENFKMDKMSAVQKDQAYIPTDIELKEMYESAKENEVNKVLHRSNRSILVNSVIGIIALVLFGGHWILLKKIGREEV